MAINDGGPAYPLPFANEHRTAVEPWYVGRNGGMTLRDYMAAAALTGVLSNQAGLDEISVQMPDATGDALALVAAKGCYLFADAMLLARSTPPADQAE